MRAGLRRAGLAAVAVVALPIVTGGVLLALFDWNWLKDTVVVKASEATGRKVVIDGDIDGEFALIPRIRIHGLRIANADWVEDRSADFVAVDRLTFRVDLSELLRGRVVLPELDIAGAELSLGRNADGEATWDLGPSVAGAAAEASVPEDRTEVPAIGRLTIADSRLRYFDLADGTEIRSTIDSIEAEGDADPGIRLQGEGTYRGQPFELTATGGGLLNLREASDPYPVDIGIAVGATRFDAKGTVDRPLAFDGVDARLALSGPDLADLYPIIGVPLPPTADYDLKGHLARNGELWTFTGIDGRVGDSDLAGDIEIDVGQEVPFMEADLTSERLDFADLGGLIGAPPDRETPTKGAGRVLPDMAIDLQRLRTMNMRVSFEGKRIIAPKFPANDVAFELALRDGELTLDPLSFGIAQGTVSGPVVLDGRDDIPGVRLDLTLKSIRLKPFLTKFEMGDLTKGIFGGQLDIEGHGKSLAEVLATADGRVTVAMTNGSLNPLLVELAGLDIAQALAVVLTEGEPVPIRCMLGDFRAENGLLGVNGFVVDTTDSNIYADGRIDLGNENLQLRLRAEPKDASLLSANAPLAVSGILKNPEVAIDTLGTENKGGVVEAVGKIVNPILALLPFVDIGLAEDTNCRQWDTDAKSGTVPAAVSPTPERLPPGKLPAPPKPR